MNRVTPVLTECKIPVSGAVPFSSCLPLLPCRAAARVPEHAKTVIVCGFPYYTGEHEGRNLSRYAIVPDYHRIAGEMLQTACAMLSSAFSARFVPFVDNSPIREASAAARAGLGVIGENSLLLHPVYGSWLFLGTIVTDLALSLPQGEIRSCIRCGKCKEACPTGCIGSNGPDPSRCLSGITQKKGALSPQEEGYVKEGGLLWGCDVCQEVCPYNQSPKPTPIAAFSENVAPILTKDSLTDNLKDKPYGFRGPNPLARNAGILGLWESGK